MKTLSRIVLLASLMICAYSSVNAQCFLAASDDTPLSLDGAETSSSFCSAATNAVTLDFTGNTSVIGIDVTGSVFMSITHTYSSDLDIALISPSGTELVLASNLGGPSDDAYVNVTFSQTGTNISEASAPFTGGVVPQGGPFMAAFYGESLDGIWALRVCDNYNDDSGVIQNFGMEFCAILDGCLDPAACNFSGLGTGDPCVYPVYAIPTDPSASSSEPIILVCADAVPANYEIASDQCCIQARIDDDPFCINTDWDGLCVDDYEACIAEGAGCTDIGGCTDKCAPNFNADATEDDGSCEVYATCPEDNCFSQYYWDTTTCTCQEVIIDYFCDDEDDCTIDFVDPVTCECVFAPIEGCGPVLGCIYPEACNYNSEATEDDGSCTFGEQAYFLPIDITGIAPIISGCSGSIIEGYEEAANQCCVQERIDFDPYCINTDWDSFCEEDYNDCLANSAICNAVPGCTDQCAPNYSSDATEDDGSCECYDTSCPDNTCFSSFFWDESSCGCIEVAIDIFCDDFDPCTIDYVDAFTCGCVHVPLDGCGIIEVLGCTYPDACNYDASATLDDGSCQSPGCTDPFAVNYDPTATCDASPTLCYYDSGCPGDLNNDFFVNTADLSIFLGVFGTPCLIVD